MYQFKTLPESVRSVLIAISVVVLQIVVATDLTKIENWHVWLIALAAAAAHALGVAVLAAVSPAPVPPTDPAPVTDPAPKP